VNWFRKNSQGKFLWPGFGENIRVLEWIFDRVKGRVDAEETALGWAPISINTEGLDISKEDLQELFSVKPNEWGDELKSQAEFFEEIGNKLPRALWYEHEALKKRLG
jgi:phosphoenolpyruvate carboxykinase (GTP)